MDWSAGHFVNMAYPVWKRIKYLCNSVFLYHKNFSKLSIESEKVVVPAGKNGKAGMGKFAIGFQKIHVICIKTSCGFMKLPEYFFIRSFISSGCRQVTVW